VRRSGAALASAIFLAIAPGTMAGLIPWLITGWRFESPVSPWLAMRWIGGVLLVVSAGFLIHAFARFAIDGLGTPAPVAPTQRLVVTGVYRHVRNPMYVAVTGAIVGQALLFGQLGLLLYAAIFLGVTAAFVRLYEEPTLLAQFPLDYPAYHRAVRGWWPRLRPWRAGQDGRTEQ